MAFITSGYVDASIGTSSRLAVAPDTASFTHFETQARAIVKSVADHAGYTLSDTTDDELVKLMTMGQWAVLAFGQKRGLAFEAVESAMNVLDLVYQKKLPLGSDPSTRDGIGGVKFSSTASGTGRTQYFGGRNLRDYWND